MNRVHSSIVKPRRRGCGNIVWMAPLVICCLVVGSYFFWPFNFGSISICDTCAVTRRTRKWQLPFGFITWKTTHRPEEPTPLSLFLTESSTVGPHEHTWVFIRGAGNGIL